MSTRAQKTHLEAELRRAAEADALLSNPLFSAALTHFRDELTKSRLQTAPADVVSREWFHMLEVAALRLEQILKQHIRTGQMAANMLEAERKTNQKSK